MTAQQESNVLGNKEAPTYHEYVQERLAYERSIGMLPERAKRVVSDTFQMLTIADWEGSTG